MTPTRRAGSTSATSKGRSADLHGDQQLELDWLPPATAATPDLVCWLWAAFPPRQGRLNIAQIARALGVAPTTMRRWVHTEKHKLTWPQIRRIHQRAILRGRGHYLWPDLDPVSRRRGELTYATAVRHRAFIAEQPERIPEEWRENGTMDPHQVHVVHFGRAHVFGVASTRHDKALAKIRRHGEILESVTVPNKYAAIALKHEILARVDEHRCVAPRELVPTGRTETWREAGGPVGVRPPLEVTVVRFAGLPRSERVVDELAAIAGVDVASDQPAHGAQEACEALTRAADVVVLTGPGYSRRSWREQGTKRPWPGGVRYVGDRRARGAGMSFEELLEGAAARGGVTATTLLVLDVDELDTPALRDRVRDLAPPGLPVVIRGAQKRPQGPSAGRPKGGRRRPGGDQLVELVARAARDRESGAEELLEGLEEYRLT